MSHSREARVFKHLRQLYAGKHPEPFRPRRKGPPEPTDTTWARKALDLLIGRRKKP